MRFAGPTGLCTEVCCEVDAEPLSQAEFYSSAEAVQAAQVHPQAKHQLRNADTQLLRS